MSLVPFLLHIRCILCIIGNMKTKVCSKCKIDKPHSDYFKDTHRAIGIRCKCKKCCQEDTMQWRAKNKSEYNSYAVAWRAKNPGRQHANDIKRNYGLGIDTYNQMLVDQDYKCKICRKAHRPDIQRGRLYVDHCHSSLKVRGLLCSFCNAAIGYFKDDTALLEKAIAYLKE